MKVQLKIGNLTRERHLKKCQMPLTIPTFVQTTYVLKLVREAVTQFGVFFFFLRCSVSKPIFHLHLAFIQTKNARVIEISKYIVEKPKRVRLI